MKIICSLILASMLVFSLITVGRQLDHLILSLESGPYISILVFSGLALICVALMFVVFKLKPKQSEPKELKNLGIDFQKILLNFYEGLNEGIEKAKDESPLPQTRIENEDLAEANSRMK